jgi:hypothetical protein
MTTELQSDYASELKAIKEKEEETGRRLAQRKKELELELQRTEEESNKAIANARSSAEKLVLQEVEKARATAQMDADRLLLDKRGDSQKIAARKLSESEIRRIIDNVLLSEFKQ